MNIKYQEVLKKILLYFGVDKQKIKFIEEASELITELARFMLGMDVVDKIIEETADLIVVGSQLTLIDVRPLDYGLDVSVVKTMRFINIAIGSVVDNDEDLIDCIKTAMQIARKYVVQMGYEKELDAKIQYKLDRTIEYIEDGKYESILA